MTTALTASNISDKKLYRFVVQKQTGGMFARDFSGAELRKVVANQIVTPDGRVGHSRLREELRGEPCFEGFAGPMWDGIDKATGLPVVRYESWAANERLSA